MTLQKILLNLLAFGLLIDAAFRNGNVTVENLGRTKIRIILEAIISIAILTAVDG